MHVERRAPSSVVYSLIAVLSMLIGTPCAYAAAPLPVKVMIVSTFGSERDVWLAKRHMDRLIEVPGLPADNPAVNCDASSVCQVTTGMGFANASASIAALVYSGQFDLKQTYWLIAGMAGINPRQGTLGSATWPHYPIDGGLQWELDAREKPPTWPSGYSGIGASRPDAKPQLTYGTEVFELNDTLVQRAVELSKGAKLADSRQAQQTRAAYPAPANQPPAVIQCDTVSDDTWVSGADLNQRWEAWTKLLTNGRGVQCTTQQEDNAILTVLHRAALSRRLDDRRVLVLRTASDFDQAPPGGSDATNLFDFEAQGGFGPAIANLFLAGNPVIEDIVNRWSAWSIGLPP